MHSLITGMTESGKTSLAKLLARKLKKAGKKIYVLDPVHDPEWEADFQTNKPDEFLEFIHDRKNWGNAHLFIDESGRAIGRYSKPMEFLGTTSRHFGYSCWCIVHRVEMIPVVLRQSCSQCFAFCALEEDLKTIASEFCSPLLRRPIQWRRYWFIRVGKFSPPFAGMVDLKRGKIVQIPLDKMVTIPTL